MGATLEKEKFGESWKERDDGCNYFYKPDGDTDIVKYYNVLERMGYKYIGADESEDCLFLRFRSANIFPTIQITVAIWKNPRDGFGVHIYIYSLGEYNQIQTKNSTIWKTSAKTKYDMFLYETSDGAKLISYKDAIKVIEPTKKGPYSITVFDTKTYDDMWVIRKYDGMRDIETFCGNGRFYSYNGEKYIDVWDFLYIIDGYDDWDDTFSM